MKNLPGFLAQEGMEDVDSHVCRGSNEYEFAMHECNLLIYDMVTRESPPADAEKISALVPKAAVETRNGAMISFERIAVIGRRPQTTST